MSKIVIDLLAIDMWAGLHWTELVRRAIDHGRWPRAANDNYPGLRMPPRPSGGRRP
jgi:hypothetical protein